MSDRYLIAVDPRVFAIWVYTENTSPHRWPVLRTWSIFPSFCNHTRGSLGIHGQWGVLVISYPTIEMTEFLEYWKRVTRRDLKSCPEVRMYRTNTYSISVTSWRLLFISPPFPPTLPTPLHLTSVVTMEVCSSRCVVKAKPIPKLHISVPLYNRASNSKSLSMSWRHNGTLYFRAFITTFVIRSSWSGICFHHHDRS